MSTQIHQGGKPIGRKNASTGKCASLQKEAYSTRGVAQCLKH